MSTVTRLAQAAFAAYYRRAARAELVMPDSWDMQPEDVRSDWEAVAAAVAAQLGRPAFRGVSVGFHGEDGGVLGPLCCAENTDMLVRFGVPAGTVHATVRLLRQLACICPCGPCNSDPASHCGIIGTGCPK